MVDTLGWLLKVQVTSAQVQDHYQVLSLLRAAQQVSTRLELVWADEGYQSNQVADQVDRELAIRLVLVPKPAGKGFRVAPRRWVVERTFAWLGRFRRLSKDYEYHVQTSESWIYLAMSRNMLRHLARGRS